MLEKNRETKGHGQSIIRRRAKDKAPAAVKTAPTPKERQSRYGKRLLTVKGKGGTVSVMADYLHDGTVDLFLFEEDNKTLLQFASGVARSNARKAAIFAAKVVNSMQSLSKLGNLSLELNVK